MRNEWQACKNAAWNLVVSARQEMNRIEKLDDAADGDEFLKEYMDASDRLYAAERAWREACAL